MYEQRNHRRQWWRRSASPSLSSHGDFSVQRTGITVMRESCSTSMLLNKQRKAWEEDVIKNFVIYMPVSREVLLEMAWRMLLLKASWMSDIKKKKGYMCHFSTAPPWLSSDNYGLTTRVKLKLSTLSENKIERDTVKFFGYWNLICRKGRHSLPALSFTSERRKSN